MTNISTSPTLESLRKRAAALGLHVKERGRIYGLSGLDDDSGVALHWVGSLEELELTIERYEPAPG